MCACGEHNNWNTRPCIYDTLKLHKNLAKLSSQLRGWLHAMLWPNIQQECRALLLSPLLLEPASDGMAVLYLIAVRNYILALAP